MRDKHTVILLSGGIDSATTLAVCQDSKPNTSALFVNYGQAAVESEWKAAQDIASHYGVKIERVELGFDLVADNGEFFGRNALFILTAAGVVHKRPLDVALGIHSLTDYYDTTPALRQTTWNAS